MGYFISIHFSVTTEPNFFFSAPLRFESGLPSLRLLVDLAESPEASFFQGQCNLDETPEYRLPIASNTLQVMKKDAVRMLLSPLSNF